MKNKNNFPFVAVFVAIFSIGYLGAISAMAQSDDKEPPKEKRSIKSRTRGDSDLISVFKSISISASESTVKVQNGRLQIAVGTIVDGSGLVLTKASEMRGDLKCRLPNGDVKAANVIGIDTENDLALLKIDAEGLSEAPLQAVEPPTRGMWLVSPTDQAGALTVGVVGVNEREIPPSRAFIGIQMDRGYDGGVLITSITPGAPAEKARLRANDVIVKLDEVEIKNMDSLVKTLGTYSPGTEIRLTILPNEKENSVRLTLADATQISPMSSRSRAQNSMGSRPSRRGKDFPRAFQHDMVLSANQCGGPVVDLDGNIVGINIARAGRVSNLAIPVDAVLDVIDKLKSGEFAPVNVNADRIKASEEELEKTRKELEENASTVDESKQGFDTLSAKIDELDRMMKEIKQRSEQVYEERKALSKTKRVLESKNKEAKKLIQRLELKIENLKAGKKY